MRLVTTKGLEFERKSMMGFPAYLNIRQNGEYIGRFYYNMSGYNSDFTLTNDAGVRYHLGESPESKIVREFKRAIREGFVNFTAHK